MSKKAKARDFDPKRFRPAKIKETGPNHYSVVDPGLFQSRKIVPFTYVYYKEAQIIQEAFERVTGREITFIEGV